MGIILCCRKKKDWYGLNIELHQQEEDYSDLAHDKLLEKKRELEHHKEIVRKYNEKAFFQIPAYNPDDHYWNTCFRKDWYIKFVEIFTKIEPLFDKNHV